MARRNTGGEVGKNRASGTISNALTYVYLPGVQKGDEKETRAEKYLEK